MASKFTFKIGGEKIELRAYASPRGLRIKDKRPTKVKIETNEEFDAVELQRYIDYLIQLNCAMAVKL